LAEEQRMVAARADALLEITQLRQSFADNASQGMTEDQVQAIADFLNKNPGFSDTLEGDRKDNLQMVRAMAESLLVETKPQKDSMHVPSILDQLPRILPKR
jgi:dsDNA-binding SOS-regulon protein